MSRYSLEWFRNRRNHKHALVLANGEAPSRFLAHDIRKDSAFFVALDGAAHQAFQLDLKPDVILGDLDSLKENPWPDLSPQRISNQDMNDLTKGLEWCKGERAEAVTLLGALGQRLDHVLTNLQAVARFSSDFPIQIEDDRQIAFVCPIKKVLRIEGWPKRSVSLFPLSPHVGPVWTEGLLYSVRDRVMSPMAFISTLNCMEGNSFTLQCHEGSLLVMLSK